MLWKHYKSKHFILYNATGCGANYQGQLLFTGTQLCCMAASSHYHNGCIDDRRHLQSASTLDTTSSAFQQQLTTAHLATMDTL